MMLSAAFDSLRIHFHVNQIVCDRLAIGGLCSGLMSFALSIILAKFLVFGIGLLPHTSMRLGERSLVVPILMRCLTISTIDLDGRNALFNQRHRLP